MLGVKIGRGIPGAESSMRKVPGAGKDLLYLGNVKKFVRMEQRGQKDKTEEILKTWIRQALESQRGVWIFFFFFFMKSNEKLLKHFKLQSNMT